VGIKVAKYSQRQMDLLDLETNRFASHFLADVLTPGTIPVFTYSFP